jgi:hypothetical protein
MKRLAIVLALTLLAILTIGAQLTFAPALKSVTKVASTYVNSRVDTITYVVEGNERLLQFYMNPHDSVSLTRVVVKRQFNGFNYPTIAGDTILTAVVAITADTLIQASVPWTVPCEKLIFIVTYASSANGVTTPVSNYGLVRIR